MATTLIAAITAHGQRRLLGQRRYQCQSLAAIGVLQHFVSVAFGEDAPIGGGVGKIMGAGPANKRGAGSQHRHPEIKKVEASVIGLIDTAWQEAHRAQAQSITTGAGYTNLKSVEVERYGLFHGAVKYDGMRAAID